MSSDRRPPDDRELDAFLRGDDAVSRGYRQGKDGTQPPAQLDAAVLDFARASARQAQGKTPRSRWRRLQAPLAVAATLVLSLGVMLNLWQEPDVRAPAPGRDGATPVVAAVPPSQDQAVVEQRKAMADRAAESAAKVAPPVEAEQAEALAPKRVAPAAAARPQAEPPLAQSPPPPPPAAAMPESAMPARPQAPVPVPAQPADLPAPAPAPNVAAPTAADDAAPMQRREADIAAQQRSFAAREQRTQERMAASAAAGDMAQSKALAASAPAVTRFDTLALGSATRAEVQARYGEPNSQGLSSAEADNPDRRPLIYDAYQRLPGQKGLFEFYYERNSLRLMSVRQVLQTPVEAPELARQLGWQEPPLVMDWRHPPCTGVAEAAAAAQAPLYWFYPARKAYFFMPGATRVEQVVYEAECS